MPWTPAQINHPTDQFAASETDRLNSIAHGRRLDEQSLLQDRYDNRFAAEAVLQGRQNITDRKNQLTDLDSARANALQDRNDLYGFYDDTDTYQPGLNQASQESLDESRNKTARKTARRGERNDWRTNKAAHDFSSKRYAELKAEAEANRREIIRVGGSVFHVDTSNIADEKTQSRTRSFIQKFEGRYLTADEGAKVEQTLSEFAQFAAPGYNKYNLDNFRAAIVNIHEYRRQAANAKGELPKQDVNALLEERIEVAEQELLLRNPELSQAWNALQSRKQQIDRELQILAPKALSPPGPDPRRRNRNPNPNAGAGLGPIPRGGPPVAGPSGPPTGGPGPAASLGLGGTAPPSSIRNQPPTPGDNTDQNLQAAQQYLNAQGISVASFRGGAVLVDKPAGAGLSDGGKIIYLLNADNWMTIPTGWTGNDEDMSVASLDEIDEFKYRIQSALEQMPEEIRSTEQITGILYQSLGPTDTDATPGGFFEGGGGAGQPFSPAAPAASAAPGTPPTLQSILGPPP
jgi:hypothetical protein